jgi:acyl-CoA dehydrogenase
MSIVLNQQARHTTPAMPLSHLTWPFFTPAHQAMAQDLQHWAHEHLHHEDITEAGVDQRCRELVLSLGRSGWLRYCVPAEFGGALPELDSRALCIAREALAFHHGLADFVFAMQGLGSGAITLAGNTAQREHWLPKVASGEAIAAFALSEPQAGSDVGAMQMQAERTSSGWLLNGTKTWISNGGLADVYTVFARTEPAKGARGISAFIVPATTPGLNISQRIEVIAPHPLATLQFENCTVPESALLGTAGAGFKLAMATLDIFRASVAAAALGFARRALAEAVTHTRSRPMFGETLADLPIAQARLADMDTAIDSAALLTYRAAWQRDIGNRGTAARATREAAMAKMVATENAQQVIDSAVQLFGGRGVTRGEVVESLYREIRALRIYEGATDVQKLIIARELLAQP